MAANRKETHRVAGVCLFLIYLMALFYFLFVSEKLGRSGQPEYRYNLTLLKEIKRFANYENNSLTFRDYLLNVVGNVVAFIPMGFLIPVLRASRHGKLFVTISTTLLGAIASALIEIIQFCFKIGSFDVDDILLNTVGTFVGALLFAVISSLVKKKK